MLPTKKLKVPLGERRARIATEHQLQSAVFDWRLVKQKQIPQLKLLHAIPNGAKLPFTNKLGRDGKTKRRAPQAYKLKREGLTPGMPDVSWPVPRGQFIGLWIEHKRDRTMKVSDEQADKMRRLEAEGHHVIVSHSAQASIDAIMAYWELGPFRPDSFVRRMTGKPEPTSYLEAVYG